MMQIQFRIFGSRGANGVVMVAAITGAATTFNLPEAKLG
jgi:hypothetical protein